MVDQSLPPKAQEPSVGATRRRALWPLAAVVIVAVVGAGAGAYFGLRGTAGPGSGPGDGPPARAFAAAAYDAASHQVVLFGGIGAEGAALNDTWTWDGSRWTQQHPATSPPARAFAAMTYDPNAHDVVLVGGSAVSYSPPTVCSGSITAGGPNATPGVAHPPVACNASPPSVFSDTWVWDGSTWRPAGTAPTVLLGETPALGTDPTTGQVLLLGESRPVGMSPACPSPAPSFPPGTPIPQVAIPCMTSPSPAVVAWAWSGRSWAALTAGSPPSAPGVIAGGFGALAADPTSGHLVDVRAGVEYVCGGPASPAVAVPCPLAEGSSGVSNSSGSAIASPSTPLAMPPPAPLVPKPTSLPVPVPVTTCCAGSVSTWTGAAWSNPRTFSTGPQVIPWGMAGDPAQHEIVAVTALGMWTWDGSSWRAQHPATSPAPEEGAALVYDGVSGKLLLFGGESATTFKPTNPASRAPARQVSDELWAWDGTTWTQLTGAKASPAPSLPPAPTPTFAPPSTPLPGSPQPSRVPAPTPGGPRCTPMPTPTPTPTPGPGAGSGSGCILVPPSG